MNLEKLKQIINEYKNKFINKGIDSYRYKINHKIFKEINIKYNNIFKSIPEIAYLIDNYNNLENLHIFCYCGKISNFYNYKLGYSKYCSNKCQTNTIEWKNRLKSKEFKDKCTQTCLEKYGRKTYIGSKAFKKQSKQTCLEKYGNENYNNRNKAKQTWLNKYNVDNPNKCKEIREKIEKTNIEKYGVKCNFQVQSIKEKIKQNKLKTCKEKYNVNNVFQIPEIIEKIKKKRLNTIDKNGLNSYQRATLKMIKTKNNDIINGLNNFQRGAIKGAQTMKNDIDINGLNTYNRSQQKSVIKIYNTKKKNNSFNKSKDEEECYQLLLQKFNKEDIERQYKSKLYPFNCDFYIKSLDLYIECNFHWTHCPIKDKHKRPFKNSIEDLQELEKLKEKANEINFKGKRKLQYLYAIEVWTKRDIRKLQIFKKNKLNYKIFYKIEQFLNWFNKIKTS